jgi:hypothetical protein
MRCRSDIRNWTTIFNDTPTGVGTQRPYVAVPTLPIPDEAALDSVFAIWYRYRALAVTLTGSFSYSGSVTNPFTDEVWNVSFSGSYTVTSQTASGGDVEGDRAYYPSGAAPQSAVVDFNGHARIENETTGDIWETDADDENFELIFLGPQNATVRLDRGQSIEIIDGTNQITTQLYASGAMAFSVKSKLFDSPEIEADLFGGGAIVNVRRFTDNVGMGGGATGICEVNLFNFFGSFAPITTYGMTSTETPALRLGVTNLTALALPGTATSSADLAIPSGEGWFYGVNPALPFSDTTLNALYDGFGNPLADIETIRAAPILTP